MSGTEHTNRDLEIADDSYISMINNLVDEIDGRSGGDSGRFAAELEFALLHDVDMRARTAMRAEKSGIVQEGRGHSIFTSSIESTNRKIAEIRSRLDGKPLDEHLKKIHEEDRRPKKGFFESLIEDQNNKIAMIKAKIAEREKHEPGKDENRSSIARLSPRQRDDLQRARAEARSREADIDKTVQRTRDEIRLTTLKLQAYHSLNRILQGHIERIEKEISGNEKLDQKQIDKLNKFKDAAEKFNKKIAVLGKKKEGLSKEQEENLKKQKIARFRELEEKMKAKRKELASARRAQREAEDEKNYSSFLLPGDFMKVVKEEREVSAAAHASEVASDVESIAAAIKSEASSKDAATVSARSSAVATAEAGRSEASRSSSPSFGTGADHKAAKKAEDIEMRLFGNVSTVGRPEVDKPAVTPVTKEAIERKQKQAEFDPTYYSRKSKKQGG